VRRELKSGKRTKNMKRGRGRGSAGIAEEGEKKREREEKNHKNHPRILSKNHVVRVTSLSYLLF
jgi:hypothetical protein